MGQIAEQMGAGMRFQIGCELAYEAAGLASLVMNIEAAELPRQRILREALAITPDVPIERYTAPESGNRYLRFAVRGGKIAVRYEAEVELDPYRADPTTIDEIPVGELPFDTMPLLWPSRYSQSDRLIRPRRFRQLRRGPSARDRPRQLDLRASRIRARHKQRAHLGRRHPGRAGRGLPRLRQSRHRLVPGAGHPGPLRQRLRFASAYAWRLDPPDFHAVFEAFLDGRWYLFDATARRRWTASSASASAATPRTSPSAPGTTR